MVGEQYPIYTIRQLQDLFQNTIPENSNLSLPPSFSQFLATLARGLAKEKRISREKAHILGKSGKPYIYSPESVLIILTELQSANQRPTIRRNFGLPDELIQDVMGKIDLTTSR